MMLKFFGEIHHVLKGSCFTYTLAQALGLKESELLKLLISEALYCGHKVLICYNARKGAPLLGKRAVPETGHYCEILYGGVKVM